MSINKIKNLLFKNEGLKQTIAKNTFWLFFGQISGRLLRMALIVFAARILGPSSWGAFSYVMGIVAFMIILSDMGMSAIVIRESVKNPETSKKYFSTVFYIKLILLAIGMSFLVFGAPYLSNIPEAKTLIPLIALILLFDSLRNFGFTISRAKEKMQYEGIDEILTNLCITGFGIYFLILAPTSQSLALGYLLGIVIGFLAIAIALKNRFKISISEFDFSLIKPILKSSLPFALASFLGAIMLNTDLIMLGWMRSSEEVGFYSAAQKPVQAFYTLASLFAISIFPALTKAIKENLINAKKLLERTVSVSFLVAIPMALGGIILGDQIINLLFGAQYQSSAVAFQILMFTTLIIYPSVIISNSILAHEQQKNFITFSMIGAIGNIVFNILLIPKFGITGAAISTIFTQIASNCFIWTKMQTINPFVVLPNIKKMILAGIVMAITTYLLKNISCPLILNIIISAPIYFLVLKIQKEKLLKF